MIYLDLNVVSLARLTSASAVQLGPGTPDPPSSCPGPTARHAAHHRRRLRVTAAPRATPRPRRRRRLDSPTGLDCAQQATSCICQTAAICGPSPDGLPGSSGLRLPSKCCRCTPVICCRCPRVTVVECAVDEQAEVANLLPQMTFSARTAHVWAPPRLVWEQSSHAWSGSTPARRRQCHSAAAKTRRQSTGSCCSRPKGDVS